jgi:hypothetical protein
MKSNTSSSDHLPTSLSFMQLLIFLLQAVLCLCYEEISRCNDFFTILADRQPWRTHGSEPCADTFLRMDYSLQLMSAQMKDFNSTLYVFTTYNPHPFCSIYYPRIKLVHFDATALMQEYELGDVVKRLENVYYDDYAKVSDILRLILAHKYRHTYIDLDIHFISTDKELFQREFVGNHIWDRHSCSLEITNAAFCFGEELLIELRQKLVSELLSGKGYRYHTELGPTLFTRVFVNSHSLRYYSLNHPEKFRVEDIVSDMKLYGHLLLHLTSSVRLLLERSGTMSFTDLIPAVRRAYGLQPLKLPPSVLTSDWIFEGAKAMYVNHPTQKNFNEIALQYGGLLVTRHREGCRKGYPSEEDANNEYFEAVEVLGQLLGREGVSRETLKSARALIDQLDRDTCTHIY